MIIIMTIKILESLYMTLSPLMSMAVLCGSYYYPFCTGKLRFKDIQDFAPDHTPRQCQSWDSKSS